MDMIVTAALKIRFKSLPLERISVVVEDRDGLREQFQAQQRGIRELHEGHDLHMLDICELFFKAWGNISEQALSRC